MTVRLLATLPLPAPAPSPPELAVEAFGLRFPNPVGLAAGFDKHAEVPDQALRLGFGFVEVGGVTPAAPGWQSAAEGLPVTEDAAVINRYGLNSDGLDVVRRRLAARRRVGVVGVNIGANKDTEDRAADYVALVKGLAPVVDYLSVNVSSPNTPGLRNLQGRAMLDDLLARVAEARDGMPQGRTPLLVKIAPDVTEADLDDIVHVAKARAMDGLIVSNTTVARPASLRDPQRGETGGLSGKPLFEPPPACSRRPTCGGTRLPSGGCGRDRRTGNGARQARGRADLIQFYSAMVFKGPGLAQEIVDGLAAACRQEGLGSVAALTGRKAGEWAAGRQGA